MCLQERDGGRRQKTSRASSPGLPRPCPDPNSLRGRLQMSQKAGLSLWPGALRAICFLPNTRRARPPAPPSPSAQRPRWPAPDCGRSPFSTPQRREAAGPGRQGQGRLGVRGSSLWLRLCPRGCWGLSRAGQDGDGKQRHLREGGPRLPSARPAGFGFPCAGEHSRQ